MSAKLEFIAHNGVLSEDGGLGFNKTTPSDGSSDDLGTGVRDREQVGSELLARSAVPGVHLDPPRDERGADRVLGRAWFRAGRDDLRARVREQRREVRRLRLEMDDDGDPPAAERAVGEALAREPVEDG